MTSIRAQLTTALLWLITATFLLASPLQANGGARLYLQAVPLQDEKLLVLDLLLADVSDLYAAEVQLRYDPAQLEIQDANPRLEGVQITPGPFLASEDRFVVVNRVDTQAGLINFAVTLLSPALPASGEGVLATIAFEILGAGPYAVQVVEAQLVSSSQEPLPVTTEDWQLGAVDQARPGPVPGSRHLPAWLWWTVALLVALIALVPFLVPRLKQAAGVTPEPTPAPRRRMPGASLFSSRSSAWLTRYGNHAMKQGDTQKAYEMFSQAVELDPANAEAWLGKGLVAQNETEKRICFQRVLALDPDSAMARAELRQLE